jgi:predicted dehydrogenase
MPGGRISRREFVSRAVAAAATVAIVPRRVLGGPGSPSGTITRAVIGTGSMGMGHVTSYPQTLAVCDVDKNRLARALKKAGGDCKGYGDWRHVIDRKDIDTVHIPTPPHWHALIAIAAAQSGKDVFSEKPATHFIREGRVLSDTIKAYGRVYQANAWGRGPYHEMRKLVASGLLGSPLTVVLNPEYCKTGFKIRQWSGRTNLTPQPVPPELDYDMWLGPAPYKPYHPHRVHGSFRGYWDYDEGGLGDMGQHHIDPIQYAMGKDDTGPVEIEAEAPWPQHPDACGLWGKITMKYADGTTMIIESWEWGPKTTEGRPLLEGPKGKYYGRKRTEPAGLMSELRSFPDPPRLQSFDHAVRTRENEHGVKPNAEQGHRSATLLHLANIAIRMGRKIRWDPVAERVVGDEAANRLVDIPMRAPWHL